MFNLNNFSWQAFVTWSMKKKKKNSPVKPQVIWFHGPASSDFIIPFCLILVSQLRLILLSPFYSRFPTLSDFIIPLCLILVSPICLIYLSNCISLPALFCLSVYQDTDRVKENVTDQWLGVIVNSEGPQNKIIVSVCPAAYFNYNKTDHWKVPLHKILNRSVKTTK